MNAAAAGAASVDEPLGSRLLGRWLHLPLAVRATACALHVGAIWWLSSLEGDVDKHKALWKSFLHNGAHVVVFAVLAALIWSLWGAHARAGRGAWVAFAWTVVYAVVDELHQGAVPHRHASVYDLMSDACGALIGIGVLMWLRGGWSTARRRLVCGVLGAAVSVPLATLA